MHHSDRKVVSLGISADLKALETCLIETDPSTAEVVVVVSHTPPEAGPYGDPEDTVTILAGARPADPPDPPLGHEDRKLMTAVVNRSEVAGKPVKPVVILTNDPQSALLQSVRAVAATELLVGPCGPDPPDAKLDRLVASWREGSSGPPPRLTIRLIALDRDERRDIGCGSRIVPAADVDEETAKSLAGSGTD